MPPSERIPFLASCKATVHLAAVMAAKYAGDVSTQRLLIGTPWQLMRAALSCVEISFAVH